MRKENNPWKHDYSLRVDAWPAIYQDKTVSEYIQKKGGFEKAGIDNSGSFVILHYIHGILITWI